MNQIYSLKFGLDASSAQPEILQLFKTAGDEIIQASDGLCLKTSRSENEVHQCLKEAGFASGIAVEKLDQDKLENASPNIRAFAGLN